MSCPSWKLRSPSWPRRVCATASTSSWPPTAGPSCGLACGRTSAAASSSDSTTRLSPSSAGRRPRPCPYCRAAASPGPASSSKPPSPARRAPSSAVPWRAESGRVAPPLRLLPTLIGESALRTAGPAADGAPAALPFAVEEHRLELVRLDLFEGSPHLLVLGDAECGKTSLLRLIARQLAARYPPEEVALLVVDLRRGLLDLTALPNLAGYACAPATVAQAVEHLHRELTDAHASGRGHRPLPRARWRRPGMASAGTCGVAERVPELAREVASPGWPGRRLDGPRYVVLVDDDDLLPASTGSPLLPLLDLLGLGRELGLHLVLAPPGRRGRQGGVRTGLPAASGARGAGAGAEWRPRRGTATRRSEGGRTFLPVGGSSSGRVGRRPSCRFSTARRADPLRETPERVKRGRKGGWGRGKCAGQGRQIGCWLASRVLSCSLLTYGRPACCQVRHR